MRFDTDHWRDKRYVAIREELEHAGFSCVRADELKSSGAIVDEVCRLLRDADLVVIDSSGDSQSVSYEIGYCHGTGRSPESTLLLRSDANIPFNYQHYRHRIYKDLRHLRRLIRDYLRVYEPLSDDQYGYTFTFSFSPDTSFGYIREGAFCIFDALQMQKFSGRCECYSAEHFELGRFFGVGIMLRHPGRKPTSEYKWWVKLQAEVERIVVDLNGSIVFEADLSEFVPKRAMRATMLPCGVAEFSNGFVTRLLDPGENTFFTSYREHQLSSTDSDSSA